MQNLFDRRVRANDPRAQTLKHTSGIAKLLGLRNFRGGPEDRGNTSPPVRFLPVANRHYAMRQVRTVFFAAAAFTLAVLPAYAAERPDFNAPYPVQHMREASLAPEKPYAMNYTDQMAQSLGVKDGQWEAFHSRDPLIPSLNGGMGASGHPMLKLQWTP